MSEQKTEEKSVKYVLINRRGEIAAFSLLLPKNNGATDSHSLELYAPDLIRGYAKARLNQFLAAGFSLSNWHIVEGAQS